MQSQILKWAPSAVLALAQAGALTAAESPAPPQCVLTPGTVVRGELFTPYTNEPRLLLVKDNTVIISVGGDDGILQMPITAVMESPNLTMVYFGAMAERRNASYPTGGVLLLDHEHKMGFHGQTDPEFPYIATNLGGLKFQCEVLKVGANSLAASRH